MRSFRLLSLICTLLVLARLSTAWEWPEAEKRAEAPSSTTSETTATATSTTQTESGSSSTESGSSITQSGSSATETGSTTQTGTNTRKETKSTETVSSSTSIFVDPRLPPGGISLISPAPTTTTYYKIGNFVTFAWNYTSLSVTPSGIDVIASCSSNSATYTLASNMSVSPTGAVTWDTHEFQATATASPLLTASYTLIVYEAGTQPSDIASAGHLGSSSFVFGMYLPQPYTPLNDYVCATCNAAISETERQALGFVLTMVTLTVLSFSWFAGIFGVFS